MKAAEFLVKVGSGEIPLTADVELSDGKPKDSLALTKEEKTLLTAVLYAYRNAQYYLRYALPPNMVSSLDTHRDTVNTLEQKIVASNR